MCSGVVNARPKDVLALLEDNSRVHEYNSFCERIKHVALIGGDTRITWVGCPRVYFFKPRDFCTAIHTRKLRDGTVVVLSRAVAHKDAPVTPSYQRAAIVVAANIIRSVPGNPNKCHVTMLSQVDPGGFIPPSIINLVRSIFSVSLHC